MEHATAIFIAAGGGCFASARRWEMAMGSAASRSWTRFWTRHERRLLLVGLDAAGKTTILYHVRLGKTISSIPTLGFNVETVKYDGLKLHLWVRGPRVVSWRVALSVLLLTASLPRQDVGGQDSLRPYWRHHFTGTQVMTAIH
jgi:GTPase SAR1 family protein